MLNTGDCSDVGSSSTDTSDSKFSIENNEASTVLIIAKVSSELDYDNARCNQTFNTASNVQENPVYTD